MSPIKYSWKSEALPLLLALAAWVAGWYFYAHFPAQVISHWNAAGQPNGYSSRAVGAFLLPAILTGVWALFYVLPLIDPRRERYESFARVYKIFRDLILAVLLAIFIISGAANLGYPIRMEITVLIAALVPVIYSYVLYAREKH